MSGGFNQNRYLLKNNALVITMNKNKKNAILIIGPTGAGKTPLGEICGKNGLWKKNCFHFDFGESLRSVASGGKYRSLLNNEDILFVKKVLREGALLENETFYIAENILQSFISENKIEVADRVLLNGLPRHRDQAGDVAKIIDITSVISLDCTPEVIVERIRLNTGGDRSERKDDSLEEIKNKLEIFQKRTVPLIDYFKSQKASINTYTVGIHTTPDDLYHLINKSFL